MSNKEAERATLAAAKQKLIREGELYRVSVLHAKTQVAHALHPEALLHGAFDHAVGVAQARFGALLGPDGLSGLNLKSLMPYAITVGSFIARKRLIKPALMVGAVAAIGGALLLRRKRKTEA